MKQVLSRHIYPTLILGVTALTQIALYLCITERIHWFMALSALGGLAVFVLLVAAVRDVFADQTPAKELLGLSQCGPRHPTTVGNQGPQSPARAVRSSAVGAIM